MIEYSKIMEVTKMTEEEYLERKGYGRSSMGDAALHKNRGGMSDKSWSKIVDRQAARDRGIMNKRIELRKEYWDKVQSGEIIPPTRIERLIKTANGYPEKEATMAARRLLKKMGVELTYEN